MANSGSKKFSRFILFCIIAGGLLIWNRFGHIDPSTGKPRVSETSNEGEASLEKVSTPRKPTSVFTSEAACYLLSVDADTRAGEMYNRGFKEQEIEEDKSTLYSFFSRDYDVNTDYIDYFGWVKFYGQQDFYYIAFSSKKAKENFLSVFPIQEKNGDMGDCKGLYRTDKCYACDMDFRKKMGRYMVLIARSREFCKPENRLSKN